MTTIASTPLSPALRRITADLGATDVESHVTPSGETVAEFHAMGQRFQLRIDTEGKVLQRACFPDPHGVLARRELEAIRDLCHRELANFGKGHMCAGRDGRNIFDVLCRAEIKLELLLAAEVRLTAQEAGLIASALSSFAESVMNSGDTETKRFVSVTLEALHTKLGVSIPPLDAQGIYGS